MFAEISFMRSFIIFLSLFCFLTSSVFAQTSEIPIKKENPLEAGKDKFAVKQISKEDWRIMEDALLADNWAKSARLAKNYLEKLKFETSDKQIARLRYIYLYSLAGKVLSYSFAERNTEEEKAREELKRVSNELIGERFMFPTRRILTECTDVLNYICPAKNKPGFLYVIAANQTGTVASPSIEYFDMGLNFDIEKHNKKVAVLTGVLDRVEFNPKKTNVWIMRLYFEDGFVAYLFDDPSKEKAEKN